MNTIQGFVPASLSASKHSLSASKKIRPIHSFHSKNYDECTSRIGFRNRLKSSWKKIASQKNEKIRRRTMVVSAASVLVTLLARPTITLAMGAMGGSKGPVAPMQR
jgi:hypothetical protein